MLAHMRAEKSIEGHLRSANCCGGPRCLTEDARTAPSSCQWICAELGEKSILAQLLGCEGVRLWLLSVCGKTQVPRSVALRVRRDLRGLAKAARP